MSSKSFFHIFLASLIFVFLFRFFVIDSFLVKGNSMAPAVLNKDYIFVNKLAYRFNEPERGDIVVLKPRNSSTKLIKRIIGLPGERVEINEGIVKIKENRTDGGQILNESYVSYDTPKPIILNLDPEEFFVLGDNRYVSVDSRELGPFDLRDIDGKLLYVLSIRKLIDNINNKF